MFLAVSLSPLPFLLVSADFWFMASVISVFSVCMCLWGKRHHIFTFFRLSLTAFLGCVFGSVVFPVSMPPSLVQLIAFVVLGALSGMILGYFWVENFYDRLRFQAEIQFTNSERSDLREPRYEWAGKTVMIVFALELLLFLTALL